jgi:hypothetical protein
MSGDDKPDPYTLSKAWVSDDDLDALKMDRTVFHQDSSPAAMARRILAENSPAAAMSLVKLALHGESDSVRLSAAKQVLLFAFEQGSDGDGREPWEILYDKILSDVESHLKEAAQHTKSEAAGNTGGSEDEGDGLKPFDGVVD